MFFTIDLISKMKSRLVIEANSGKLKNLTPNGFDQRFQHVRRLGEKRLSDVGVEIFLLLARRMQDSGQCDLRWGVYQTCIGEEGFVYEREVLVADQGDCMLAYLESRRSLSSVDQDSPFDSEF